MMCGSAVIHSWTPVNDFLGLIWRPENKCQYGKEVCIGLGGGDITRHFLRASCLYRYRSELQQWDEQGIEKKTVLVYSFQRKA